MPNNIDTHLATLTQSLVGDNRDAGLGAIMALVGQALHDLNRIASALEKLAERPAA